MPTLRNQPKIQRKHLPIGFYTGAVAVFNSLLVTLLWKNKRLGSFADLSLQDMILLGGGTHKLSRVITKDLVTTPFRAPFTEVQDFLGYGEVQETAKGTGVREGIGEILSCSYCADFWIALGLMYARQKAPIETKLLLKFFFSLTIADFLHVAFEATRTQSNVLTLKEEQLEREQKKAA